MHSPNKQIRPILYMHQPCYLLLSIICHSSWMLVKKIY